MLKAHGLRRTRKRAFAATRALNSVDLGNRTTGRHQAKADGSRFTGVFASAAGDALKGQTIRLDRRPPRPKGDVLGQERTAGTGCTAFTTERAHSARKIDGGMRVAKLDDDGFRASGDTVTTVCAELGKRILRAGWIHHESIAVPEASAQEISSTFQ